MAKLTLRSGKELTESTVDAYVADLAARLARELPEVDVNEIVAETGAHLADCVDSLIAEGSTLAEAERVALAGFGSAQTFGAKVAASVTETRTTRLALRTGRLAITGTFIAAITLTGTYPNSTWASLFDFARPGLSLNAIVTEPVLGALFLAAMLAAAGIPICAFLARRAQTRAIIIAASAALALLVLPLVYIGPGGPPSVAGRSTIGEILQRRQNLEMEISNQEALIRGLGSTIARARDPLLFKNLVWKVGGRAPGSLPRNDGLASCSDFASHMIFPTSPDVARAAWTTNGPAWLEATERLHRTELKQLATFPRWIDWNEVRSFGLWTWLIPFAAALIALDRIAAWVGRRAFLSGRRRQTPSLEA